MQIAILNGIYADTAPDFRTSYPLNLVPVPKSNGISKGYLRPGDGLVPFGTGPGVMRGTIAWDGGLYAVMGSKLVNIGPTGTVTTLGDVGDDGRPVTFDYGFDRLAIASAGALYFWDGATLAQNVDPDLGTVVDMLWVDGYYMTTDGTFLVVTDIGNPLAVNPLKYGSAEADPDPIVAILKLRNEVCALNRHTIEYFDNVGGDLFPFQRIEGAQIEKGCVGTHACCLFMESIAFLGGGFNEQPAIYIGGNATATKISTHEIDTIIAGYSEAQLAEAKLEARNDGSHQFLYVHLPDRTLVFDGGASGELKQPVWFVLSSAETGIGEYRARHFVWAYDKWLFGDTQSAQIGQIVQNVSSHWGHKVPWEFGTVIVYNESRGVLFHELELVSLTGSVAFGESPTIATQYSLDGVSWSQERTISAGGWGTRAKRLVWLQQGAMQNWRIQRFRGTSDAHIAMARLEARLEPLAW